MLTRRKYELSPNTLLVVTVRPGDSRTCSGRPEAWLEADTVLSPGKSVGDLKRLEYSGPRDKTASRLIPARLGQVADLASSSTTKSIVDGRRLV